MKFTDEQVIKALECCGEPKQIGCTHCPVSEDCMNGRLDICTLTLDLINRQKAENKDLFYKLTGVMHSVDKWLEGDELKQDEVNRAATMREKTLKLVEQKQAEIESITAMLERSQEKYEIAIDALIRAKTKDIKEFAERLIHEIVNRPSEIQSTSVEYLHGSAYRQNEIVDLVKEMVGE